MDKKTYSSFEQIDTDLDILRIEKEINYQKIILGIQKTKEQFTPTGLTKNVFSVFKGVFSTITDSKNTVLSLLIPLAIKWILNRKRSR
ncbi:DUF6327 family protein [Flavobacterium sp. UMI-01]|uniref:DUF6327 family protein n=1 Tax=Flavobacterium sp. UMI-01 TaxID=1441053 RepID=UPI001C7DF2F8|nr:DUF6327 family protein [Flavobacterium sp. UMI-01]GIZ08050.1 hypothetical protein FUMI01_07770 [Flavobacterium sp. UMI-01]